MSSPTAVRRPIVTAMMLVVAGLGLIPGGVMLMRLHGTPYYALAGAATVASGVLLGLRQRAGLWVYGAVLAVTAAWALSESGLDAWALTPRLLGPALIGVWLLSPGVRRGVGAAPIVIGRRGWMAAGAAVAIVAVGAAATWGLAPSPPAQAGAGAPNAGEGDWRFAGGDAGGTHYSALDQITPANVKDLKIAWTHHLGGEKSSLELTPLKVGDVIYTCNNLSVAEALDAETGKSLWRFDPKPDGRGGTTIRGCRGVAHYVVAGTAGPCAARILMGSIDAGLWALDAATGRPCPGFGDHGRVDLKQGMGPITPGYYYVSSAPVVARGRVVVGGYVYDNQSRDVPSGVVRAFDAVTGQFAWAWDLERPGQHGLPKDGQTYTRGSPNAWAPMSADQDLGLIYAPTGNASPDYYGAFRSAQADKYASSVVALDAATGEPRWSFQTTHHDLWDYDVPAQPVLFELTTAKGPVPALIQATKRGELFVLDRRTGTPLTKVEERPVPQGGAPGERLSLTQPFSTGMPSVGGGTLTEAKMWGLTPYDQLWCRVAFHGVRYEGTMTPPGLAGSLHYPGYLGGVDWGGLSVDPERQVVVVNSNRFATIHRLVPRAEADRLGVRPVGTPGYKRIMGIQAQALTPFATRNAAFVSPLNVPCQQPPWGVLTAIDLKSHAVIWEKPLGTGRDSGPMGLPSHLPLTMGVPTFGGALSTRAGLIFIGATQERTFRAVDIRNGRVLWSDRLAAGANATPMTYWSGKSGRQFVVVAAGGKPLLQVPLGDELVAYALPKN